MMKQLVLVLIGFVFLTGVVTAQNKAVMKAEVLNFDFGTIAEDDGTASHAFEVKNIGSAPLVITRVTVSCGCTTPEWTQSPIAPGKTGEVKVTYDPKGRPGPFYKTISVYSNGKEGPYMLGVKGTVSLKKTKPVFIYPYSIGTVRMSAKTVLYSTIYPNEALGEKILLKNDGGVPVQVHLGKYPSYLTIEARPDTIAAGKTGEITLLFDAKEAKRMGRVSTEVPLGFSTGKKHPADEGFLSVAANIIGDASKMSVADKANAASISLSSDIVDFGVLNPKNGKSTEVLTITNNGKSELLIYSLGSDDGRIDISGGKREIKAGASATFKITLRPKDIKATMAAIINVVCNDPVSPVRLIKVTAKQ